MRFLRLIALTFVFCVDVQVKAEDLKDCWGSRLPCPVETVDDQRILEAGDLHITLAPSSLIEQRDHATIQLVRGQFYIEAKSQGKFQTPYAKLWCESQCKALVERSPAEVNIKALDGRWLIQRTGEERAYVLAVGLQVSVGEVKENGLAAMEFPQSLPWAPTVKLWAAMIPGGIEKLKPELQKFRRQWMIAVDQASLLQEQTASREIASFQRSLAEERARQKAREREDQSLRDLFREKNFINP